MSGLRIRAAHNPRVQQQRPHVAARGRRRRSLAIVAADAEPRRRSLAIVAADAEPRRRRVAVVGGGVGGLCVAATLARADPRIRVTVYEQGDAAGGRCQGEWLEAGRHRYRFDTGPSLLLLPDAYRAAFRRMGRPSLEAAGLRLRRVGPDAAYRVFFTDDDGDGGAGDGRSKTRSLDLLYDPDAMIAQLDARRSEGASSSSAAAAAAAPPPPPPPAAEAYRAWLADASRMLDSGWAAFIARDFGPASDGLLALLRVLDPRVILPLLLPGGGGGGGGPRLPSNPLEMLEPHARALARRFPGDPDLQALLSFQDLYVGLSPRSAPGVFSLLAATELRDGVFYPEGGFGAVRDALLRAALDAGDVEVRTRARVRRVVVGGSAGAASVQGVEVEEEEQDDDDEGAGPRTRFEPADAVVCNADAPSAYALLSAGEGGAGGGAESAAAEAYGASVASRLLSKKEYSAGVIAYYWCVEGGALAQLPQHSVFVRPPRGRGDDAEEGNAAWRRARSADELERAPNFYVHCPARTDPSAVSHPGECDSVMVLLPVANLQEVAAGGRRRGGGSSGGGGGGGSGSSPDGGGPPRVFDERLVAAGRDAILRALAAALPGTLAEAGGASDLRARIAREEVRAPPQWRDRHALAHGAAFGLSHGLGQLAALRPALEDGRVRGFYCVGASARPGNGVPLVLTGAGLCADAVLRGLRGG
jgi:phytoene desaturase (3,4-didehydrolycopene-forming)